MSSAPEPYADWNAWALAQFDNDPRRAGLAARAAEEAQSIGAGMDAAIRAAESAAAVPPPSWVPNHLSIDDGPPPDSDQTAAPSDLQPDVTAIGGARTSGVHAGASASRSEGEAHPSFHSQPGPSDEAKALAKKEIEVPAAPNLLAAATPAATAPGMISPDGNYLWNGADWVRNIPVPAVIAANTQSGWYQDPDRRGGQRYFDGAVWTDHRTEPERPPVAQPPPKLPPTPETLARRKRGRKWWWTVSAIPVVVVLGFVIASRAQGGGGAHTLTGTIHESPWIRPGSVTELLSLGPAANGQPCDGDITSPADVVRHFGTVELKDSAGNSIASSTLGQGVIAGMGTGSVSCDFQFTFDSVPARDGYEIVATSLSADKTLQAYGSSDFTGTGWKVDIINNDY